MNWNVKYIQKYEGLTAPVEVSLGGQVVGYLDIDKRAMLDLKRRLK